MLNGLLKSLGLDPISWYSASEYRQAMTQEAKNTASTMKELTGDLKKLVGRTSEEFGRAVLQEQERMKNTSKKLFWISLIPSLILVVWELTRHIWQLG